ncbi:hypothetical protein GCM10023405_19180 [Streptomonospora salina]
MGGNREVFCPGCKEPVRRKPPRIWSIATDRPAYSHHDGEPLCPVPAAEGDSRPAEPVIWVPTE